jgi:hypothetical protein
VVDAIRLVSQKSNEKLKSLANDSEHDKEESNESDYDEDEDQLVNSNHQAKEGEEEEPATRNQVF